MRHSKSSLFLMELIIAILFFSLSGTVCIQLFAKAKIISRSTVEQNNAVTQAQNLAESWIALDGDLTKMQPLFQDSVLAAGEDLLYIPFDANWNPQASEISQAPAYIAQLQNAGEDEKGLIRADIQIFRMSDASGEEPIYSLNLTRHIQERRGGLEQQ